jgi:hypothetical protein
MVTERKFKVRSLKSGELLVVTARISSKSVDCKVNYTNSITPKQFDEYGLNAVNQGLKTAHTKLS